MNLGTPNRPVDLLIIPEPVELADIISQNMGTSPQQRQQNYPDRSPLFKFLDEWGPRATHRLIGRFLGLDDSTIHSRFDLPVIGVFLI